MDTNQLAIAVAADRAAGLRPFVVIGSAGTVNTGAFDDLRAIAEIATREQLWFHVDGAFGAWAAIADPRAQALVRGIERVDSLAFDFHKSICRYRTTPDAYLSAISKPIALPLPIAPST